ncbi:hypothetical protein AAG906_016756 [Vitis piasezkii]
MAVKCFPSRDGACCHKENTMLDCKHQRSLVTSVSSPKTPLRHSNINFHDVLAVPRGGFRIRLHDTASEKDGVLVYNPWTGLSEKPVLGEDGGNRRSYHNEDFFDDIFRGDNSVNTNPRGHDLDLAVVVPLKMIKLAMHQNRSMSMAMRPPSNLVLLAFIYAHDDEETTTSRRTRMMMLIFMVAPL